MEANRMKGNYKDIMEQKRLEVALFLCKEKKELEDFNTLMYEKYKTFILDKIRINDFIINEPHKLVWLRKHITHFSEIGEPGEHILYRLYEDGDNLKIGLLEDLRWFYKDFTRRGMYVAPTSPS